MPAKTDEVPVKWTRMSLRRKVQINTVRERIKPATTETQKDHKIKTLQQRVWKLQKQVDDLRSGLRKFLTSDQVQRLAAPLTTVWSMDTFKNCLILRFVLGDKGYEYLYKKGYPIPSPTILLRQMKCFNMQELKSESLKDPSLPLESTNTSIISASDETTNTMSDNNVTTNLVGNIIPQRCDKDMNMLDGKMIKDKDSSTFSSDLQPVEVQCRIVNVRSLNGNDESVNLTDTYHVISSDETVIETDKAHVTTSDETLNQTDSNYGANSAVALIQADTKHVQNSDKTGNLYDMAIRPNQDEIVKPINTYVQSSDETINLPDTKDVVKVVSSSVTGVPNEDDGNPMEWEICIEQDLSPSDIDNTGKSESAWQIAFAALQMSVKDTGCHVAAQKTSK